MDKFKWLVPVRLPKEVVIYNEKLSAFQVGLQGAVAGVLVYLFAILGGSYMLQITPMMGSVNFVREAMPEASYNSASQADQAGAPCVRKDQIFRFKLDSERTFTTFKCARIPKYEQYMQLSEHVGFFPTFFSESRSMHAYSGTK